MGSDLSMSPPAPPLYRLVVAGPYVALYSRKPMDGIYRVEEIQNWRRLFLTDDVDEHGRIWAEFMLSTFALSRHKVLYRDDLYVKGADEPLAETYPKDVLESDDPLQQRRAALLRELAEIDDKIKNKETR